MCPPHCKLLIPNLQNWIKKNISKKMTFLIQFKISRIQHQPIKFTNYKIQNFKLFMKGRYNQMFCWSEWQFLKGLGYCLFYLKHNVHRLTLSVLHRLKMIVESFHTNITCWGAIVYSPTDTVPPLSIWKQTLDKLT